MARTFLLGAVVVVFGAIASMAAPEPRSDLAGVYRCDGMNPDGTEYHGVVEISRVQDIFRVRWTLRDSSAVVGVGIMSEGVLAVSYFGGAPAVVVYRIDGSRLIGEWAMGGGDGVISTETLTKLDTHPRLRQPAGKRPTPTSPKAGLRI